MAEYFPLLDRAVTGLADPTPEARHAIYERARNALVGQLRSVKPAIPEPDIQRENAALDEAIARIEARFPPPAPSPLPVVRPASTQSPGAPGGKAPPVVAPPARDRPVFAPRPIAAPAAATAEARTPLSARAPASRPAAPSSALAGRSGNSPQPGASRSPPTPGSTAPAAGTAPTAGTAAQRNPAASTGPAPVLPAAPTLTLPPESSPKPAAASLEAGNGGKRGPISPDRMAIGADVRRDGVRPPAPRRKVDEPRTVLRWALAVLALIAISGIGFAAWKLRDRPEQVVAAKRASATPGENATKIMGRADAPAASDTASANSGDASSVPSPVGQGDTPTSGSAAPSTGGATGTAPVNPSAPAPDSPVIPVSQRAALLVDAPDEPQKVKTYEGSVIWRTESISPGQGQPLATAVRADVDLPDAKLKLTLVLQKNLEAQLPASHTIELRFSPQPGNTLGAIKQINVPEMRKDDEATGEPLNGVPATITDNNFLVGLSRGGAEAQNSRLLLERNWFDVSVLLVSGKVGKVTFEKGTAGQRALDDAFKSWQ